MLKRYVFVCACLLFGASNAYTQDMALGLRLGDPLGVSFKKYLKEGKNAFEAVLGTYGYMGVYRHTTLLFDGRGYYLHGDYFYRRGGVSIMANYLWNFDFPQANELSWYLSVGGQLRSLYYYQFLVGDEQRGIGIGPTFAAGLEWKPKEIPEIGVFFDAGLYLEITPAAWAIPQIGFGARYNFK
ncbi:MAG: hypothetical protein OHK0045_14840 [Raineya sp.]